MSCISLFCLLYDQVKGLPVRLQSMDSYPVQALSSESTILFVCSTFGDGMITRCRRGRQWKGSRETDKAPETPTPERESYRESRDKQLSSVQALSSESTILFVCLTFGDGMSTCRPGQEGQRRGVAKGRRILHDPLGRAEVSALRLHLVSWTSHSLSIPDCVVPPPISLHSSLSLPAYGLPPFRISSSSLPPFSFFLTRVP